MGKEPNREKYFEIAREQGLAAAITLLHKEIADLEDQAFETPNGFQPELYETLKKFRTLSRDLWEMRLDLEQPSAG